MVLATHSAKETVFAVPLRFVVHRNRIYAMTAASSWKRRREEIRDRIAATTGPDAITGILDGFKSVAALYDADSATRRPMLRIWIRCGGPFGPGHGRTAEIIRAVLDEGKNAGQVRKDLDTSTAGLVLQDVYIGALCRWAASETDSLEQHLRPALELVMPLLQ